MQHCLPVFSTCRDAPLSGIITTRHDRVQICTSHIKQCYWEGTGVLPIQTVCLWGSPVSGCRAHYLTPVCLMSCQEIRLTLLFFCGSRTLTFLGEKTSGHVQDSVDYCCSVRAKILSLKASELVTRGSQVNPWTSRINPGGECVAQVDATVVILAAYRGECMYLCRCANQLNWGIISEPNTTCLYLAPYFALGCCTITLAKCTFPLTLDCVL